jgi:hypothetical protein
MIPKFVEILKAPGFRALILKILYQLSIEDKTKASFTYTECLPLIYQLIIHCPEQMVGKELVALAVNLTINPRNAETLAADDQLQELIKRAKAHQDILLFKVIKNITQFAASAQDIMEQYIEDYIDMAMRTQDNTDLQLELVGTLVYIASDRWQELVGKKNLIEFIHNQIVNTYAEDDILLECIMLISTIMRDDSIAQQIAMSFLIKLLQDLLGAKQEDDEMVQQILNTFLKFLFFKSTRDYVIHNTDMLQIVLELLQDKNPNIRKLVDTILDHIAAYDENCKREIKRRKFETHNQTYLQISEEEEKAQGMMYGEEDPALY